MTAGGETVVHAATERLIDLAGEMRPDWDLGVFRKAVEAASLAMPPWPWRRIFGEAARMLNDPRAVARDFANLVDPRNNTTPVTGAGRAEYQEQRDRMFPQQDQQAPVAA